MDTGSLSWFKKAKKENALIEYKTQNEENTNLINFNPDTLSKAFAPSYLYLKHMEKKGFGVFTKKKIQKGETIETCYAIILNWRQRYQSDPSIYQYSYWHQCPCNDCKQHGSMGLIALGYGSIYNCADSENERNANFLVNLNTRSVTFIAEKDIDPDEEILMWWGEGYYNTWCKPKNQNT